MATDPVMERIEAAIELFRSGEVERARDAFGELWPGVLAGGDPFHRCVLAHFAADAESDVERELWWDLRALEAADEISDERAREYHGSLSVAAFYPSLHLNLADAYRRLGDAGRAGHHIAVAERELGTLADDGYGRHIRAAVARSAEAIARLAAGGR